MVGLLFALVGYLISISSIVDACPYLIALAVGMMIAGCTNMFMSLIDWTDLQIKKQRSRRVKKQYEKEIEKYRR